jgi:tetratricopeptide (TPR) repeat protein
MDVAEYCMTDRPDSSLALLETIIDGDIRLKANKARYALLYSQALDKNYIDLTDDSLINISVDYYYDRKNVRYKFLSLYYGGRIYTNAGDYTKAIISYSDAETLVDKLSDDYLSGLLYTQLGDIYHIVYDYDKSLSAYQNSLEHFQKAGKSKHEYYCILDIGMQYLNLYDFENGQKYINEAINRATEVGDTSLVLDCLSNLAILRMFNGEVDSVKELKNTLCKSVDFEDMGSQLLGSLARMYALSNKPDSAEILIEQAWKNVVSANDSISLYYDSSNVYESLGDFKKSLANLWDGVSVQNRILRNLLSQPILSAQKNYYKDQSESYNYKLKVTKHFMICIIAIIILIIALAIVLFKKRLNEKDLEIERHLNIINEIRNMNEENISKTLLKAKQQMSSYFEQVNQIGDAYYELADTEKGRNKFLSDLKSTLEKFSKDKQYYMRLEDTVNEYNDDVMLKLRNDIPGIKESDYKLLCYIIIGFSNRFISILLDEKPQNIATRKSRLRTKIINCDSKNRELFLEFMA